jgi:hypothetical protein
MQGCSRAVHPATRKWFFPVFDGWCRRGFTGAFGRVMRVRGPCGAGKSSLAALLCCQAGAKVATWHFCVRQQPDSLDACIAVRSLVYRLAVNLPSFRAALLAMHSAGADDSAGAGSGGGGDGSRATWQSSLRQIVDASSALELFEKLMVVPLRTVSPPSHRYIVAVVDGVDTNQSFTRNPLLQVRALCAQMTHTQCSDECAVSLQIVSREWGRLPHWVGLVLTSTADDALGVPTPLDHSKAVRVDPLDSNGREDARKYIAAALAHRVLPSTDVPAAGACVTPPVASLAVP